MNFLSSIALQVSSGPREAALVLCRWECGIKRRLNTHMSAKHGRHGANCDLPGHKSDQSALVLSTIDISSPQLLDSSKTENILQAMIYWYMQLCYLTKSTADNKGASWQAKRWNQGCTQNWIFDWNKADEQTLFNGSPVQSSGRTSDSAICVAVEQVTLLWDSCGTPKVQIPRLLVILLVFLWFCCQQCWAPAT